MEIGQLYFWTATINNWYPLLADNQNKKIVLESLVWLIHRQKIEVFGFVIMPTHIHLIWRVLAMNGKETPQGSLLKYTAHEFKKKFKAANDLSLANYAVLAKNKSYEFWQRDPLAFPLYGEAVAYQKLDYIHSNPNSGKWALCVDPCDYLFSSARFYESLPNDFSFLMDLRQEF